jgi:hypothetical protein
MLASDRCAELAARGVGAAVARPFLVLLIFAREVDLAHAGDWLASRSCGSHDQGHVRVRGHEVPEAEDASG